MPKYILSTGIYIVNYFLNVGEMDKLPVLGGRHSLEGRGGGGIRPRGARRCHFQAGDALHTGVCYIVLNTFLYA